MMRLRNCSILALLLALSVNCGFTSKDGPIPAKSEIVMSASSTIAATTKLGTIVIRSGEGLRRSYSWEGVTRSVEMWPRDERWYGSMGLYFPGPGDHWFPHDGISRAVVEEGQQHFQSQSEALSWLQARTWMPFVYNSTGLVVGWGKTLPRRQLNVEVWQIYINGSRPSFLPGACDSCIHVAKLPHNSPLKLTVRRRFSRRPSRLPRLEFARRRATCTGIIGCAASGAPLDAGRRPAARNLTSRR